MRKEILTLSEFSALDTYTPVFVHKTWVEHFKSEMGDEKYQALHDDKIVSLKGVWIMMTRFVPCSSFV